MTPWWVTLVTAVLVLVASLAGTWVTLRTKAKEEERLRRGLALEVDLRVAQAFSELMGRAHGRGPHYQFSEAATALVSTDVVQDLVSRAGQGDPGAPEGIRRILSAAIVDAPVGAADMDATAQLIAALAERYALLRPAAKTGLRGRHGFQPVEGLDEWLQRWDKDEAASAGA